MLHHRRRVQLAAFARAVEQDRRRRRALARTMWLCAAICVGIAALWIHIN